MENLHFEGLLIGVATFLIIGIFHPIVIKMEYYTGTRYWWTFLVAGLIALLVGLFFVENIVLNAILGAFAFSAFWGIGELFQQEKRVQKGWFPCNPKRKDPPPAPPKGGEIGAHLYSPPMGGVGGGLPSRAYSCLFHFLSHTSLTSHT